VESPQAIVNAASATEARRMKVALFMSVVRGWE
jgi:hypothetical protein